MTKKIPLTLILSLALILPSVSGAALPKQIKGQALPTLAPMLSQVTPSVVSIKVSGKKNQTTRIPPEIRQLFPQLRTQNNVVPFTASASGVIINAASGYIVTNNHVIKNASVVTVQLNSGKEYPAHIVGSDPIADIALLQLKNAKGLTQIKVADSDNIEVGDFAIAIGNAFGLGQTVTSGIVSGLGRSGLQAEGLENFIQTDAAINQGNSGGALVNLHGKLIGINTAILAPSGGSVGIGFAIPANLALNLANQLINRGKITHSSLGIKISDLTPELAKTFHSDTSNGVFVNLVHPHQAAAKAGIKAGDIITKINNHPLKGLNELKVLVATHSPGTILNMTVYRNGKPLTVPITLEEPKIAVTPATIHLPISRGAKFSDVPATSSTPAGIKVEHIEQGSLAEKMGFQANDLITAVNHQRIKNISEFNKFIASHPASIVVAVKRNNALVFLILQ